MSDIKLFRLQAGQATELQGEAADLEKPLQTLIENNLGPLLRIRFLATICSSALYFFRLRPGLGLQDRFLEVPYAILRQKWRAPA